MLADGRRMVGGRQVMRIAHMAFYARWAKKVKGGHTRQYYIKTNNYDRRGFYQIGVKGAAFFIFQSGISHFRVERMA